MSEISKQKNVSQGKTNGQCTCTFGRAIKSSVKMCTSSLSFKLLDPVTKYFTLDSNKASIVFRDPPQSRNLKESALKQHQNANTNQPRTTAVLSQIYAYPAERSIQYCVQR